MDMMQSMIEMSIPHTLHSNRAPARPALAFETTVNGKLIIELKEGILNDD